jgi:hypothetical protein
MSEFYSGKKSFSAAEVENYIKKTIFSYENKLSEQKDRIFSLLEENKKLLSELEEFKSKDAQVTKALVLAVSKAKEIEDAARQKYSMEIERLKAFHSKWVSYYALVKSKFPTNEDLLSAEEFLMKMDSVLGLNSPQLSCRNEAEAVAQFVDESKRLESRGKTKTEESNKNKKSDGSAAAVIPNCDGELDMNEVLNPKDLPELEEIIKQMGILDK